MNDPRVEKMARVIADYSLAFKPGQLVLLAAEPAAHPLVREVYRRALRAGAHPYVRAVHTDLEEVRLRESSDEQLAYVSDIARLEVEKLDARLYVRAPDNIRNTSRVDPAKRAIAGRATRGLLNRILERKGRGELASCLTQFPTNALAQLAGMSLADYEEFLFGACLLDREDPVAAWQELSATQQRYVDMLDRVSELKFEAPDTDLTVSVAGRKWINSDGKANFPSGEVFSAPVEDSACGRIRFDVPTAYQGRSVSGVVLELRDGVVTSATAEREGEFLQQMLDTDEGSSRLGEVAFGLNYGITRATGTILLDEKIGGTVHLALGNSYPDAGGRNRSAIHWDLIRSMTPGKVFADGRLIYEDGKFRE